MKRRADDRVFRALADPNRRRMLELLHEHPGMHASALAKRFAFTRIAALKHLRVLEGGGLVTRRREGKCVALYAQHAPLAAALERRLAACAPGWEQRLRGLKQSLEEGPEMADRPRHVYIVYIRTTPAKLWDAITRPEMTRCFFFGTDVKSTFAAGSPIEYVLKDPGGRTIVPVTGEVIECDPPRRLVHTFRFGKLGDAPTRVTYEIEPAGDGVVRLTLTHDGFEGETPTWKEVGGGWPRVVSSLKSLLETGTPLPVR
jgi:uncharacterized protein YndB with AHSA1/START domain/DNA-binding transcriptional ArsR family regulator